MNYANLLLCAACILATCGSSDTAEQVKRTPTEQAELDEILNEALAYMNQPQPEAAPPTQEQIASYVQQAHSLQVQFNTWFKLMQTPQAVTPGKPRQQTSANMPPAVMAWARVVAPIFIPGAAAALNISKVADQAASIVSSTQDRDLFLQELINPGFLEQRIEDLHQVVERSIKRIQNMAFMEAALSAQNLLGQCWPLVRSLYAGKDLAGKAYGNQDKANMASKLDKLLPRVRAEIKTMAEIVIATVPAQRESSLITLQRQLAILAAAAHQAA